MKKMRCTFLTIGNPVVDYYLESRYISEWQAVKHVVDLSKYDKKFLMNLVLNHQSVQSKVGGSALNSARVAGMYCAANKISVDVGFLGSIGNDHAGNLIHSACKMCHVEPFLNVTNELPTGICTVVIDSITCDRSILCDRGAANNLNVSSLANIIERIQAWQQNASRNVIFATSYNLTTQSRRDSIISLWDRYTNVENTRLGLSLSSEKVLQDQQVKQCIATLLPKTSYLLSTRGEICEYTNTTDINTAIRGLQAHMIPGSIVVATDGADVVVVGSESGIDRVLVPSVDRELIEDTTGAGDTLAAIFFSDLLLHDLDHKRVLDAVRTGIQGSQVSLQSIGIDETESHYRFS